MKTATVIQDGATQLVRLPEEFHFEGKHVYLNKVGNTVVLIPEKNPWQPLFDSLNEFTDDFLHERHQPAPQERDEIFT